ncbi:MAG: hypothetical protein KGH89_02500 [Thaumarchaeota archaeon]|nr:hypothetical protein [Nitrososphaerota archaeon]
MKKPISRKKNTTSAIITVIVIVSISAAAIYLYNQQKMSGENTSQWITSGPFSVTNGTYRLGDNIFMVVTGLKPTDIGTMVIYDPKGGVFTHVPFNGTMKSDFNYFFKPVTEKPEKLCTPQDLVGNWTISFQGTSYSPITFRIINEWVPGAQAGAEMQPIPSPC